MADIQSIISFYERCYRAESKETIIFNFLGSQVEKRFLFEEYSITDKSDALTHFTHEQLADWLKYLRLHQKEKHQVHGEIFLVGKLKYLGKNRLVCAPLVITSVDLIQENEGWRFVPNYESSIINPAIANLLTSNLDLDDSFRIELDNWLPKKSLDVKEIQGLLSILEKYGLNNQLDFQNSNVKASDISKLMKSTSPKFISSSGVGIVEKNKTEKEILADLNDLRDQYSFSKLLKSVLLKKELEKNEAITDEIIVPADLSLAQTKAIKNSQDYDVSIINGPPGTGKSFTIAAMAINAFANGQSVLISSKSDRAISVIQSKLKSHFHLGEIAVLAGTSRSSKSSVRRRIKSILSGTFQNQITNVENVEFEMKREFRALDRYEQEIIDRERGELKDGEYLSEKPDNFWTKIQKHFIAKRSIKNAPFWKLVEVYRHGIDIKNTKTQKYLSLLYKATVSNVVLQYRSMFQKLLKRVDSGTNLMRKDLEKGIDFGVITTAMPIWLSTLNDISYIYPLQKELFDLVIIDEASQCDIASIIPVLHRAKRLVIVGDQQQLRHVSFLSLDKMIEYADIEGLNLGDDVVNFRDNSILDYALDHITSQEQICFLNEHYRSIPEIIDFSNQYFYSDALNLMTKLTFESKVGGLIWRKCDGNRMASGVNEKEAREIVQSLNKLISFEEVKDMSQCSSVAIISPFRKQVNFLKSLLSQELSLQEMKKHDIIVGTPFELQGEERTRVYVSWVIDDAVQQGTLQYLDREDVFNVTITRAKDFMINFHSFDPKKIDRKSLLFEYQAHTLNYRAEETKDHYNDEFFTEVTKSLIKLEVKDDDIIPNYRVGSYTFDIFLQKGNRKYFIDLIGFPGIQEGTFPFEQYRMLFRTRSQILAIPYTYWQFNRAACLRYIEQTLNG